MNRESVPLLERPADAQSASGGRYGWFYRELIKRYIAIVILAALVISATLALFGVFGLYLFRYTHLDSRCQNGTVLTRVHTRSDSYSLLANFSVLPCSEPFAQLSLFSADSSVKVQQDYCRNVVLKQFNVEENLYDISFAGMPYPIFDENNPESESAKNYFINGSVQVIMTNITSNTSSATLDVCLFTDNDNYYKFVYAGESWKTYKKNASCHTIPIGNGALSLNISKPSFVFLGIASSQLVNISHLYFNATGYDISNLGANSSSVCQLSSDNRNCSFHLLNTTGKNETVCVVAFEQGTGDGSYDYSNLMIGLPTPAEKYGKEPLYGFGLGSLGSLLLAVLVLVILAGYTCLYCNRNRNQRIREQRSDRRIRSVNSDTEDDINSQHDPSIQTNSVTIQEDTTCASSALVVASRAPTTPTGSQFDRVTLTNSESSHTPIQETEHSPAASPKQDTVTPLPVQENATQFSSTVVDYRTEGSSEPGFGYGASETAQGQ